MCICSLYLTIIKFYFLIRIPQLLDGEVLSLYTPSDTLNLYDHGGGQPGVVAAVFVEGYLSRFFLAEKYAEQTIS